jgi:hypothetical protein
VKAIREAGPWPAIALVVVAAIPIAAVIATGSARFPTAWGVAVLMFAVAARALLRSLRE